MPAKINLLGQQFGKLTVISPATNHNGRTSWTCQCECGNQVKVTTQLLRNGTTKSCGCLKRKDLIGKRFGQLTVLKDSGERKHGYVVWECQCDCGNIAQATTEGLRTGDNVSCGCRNKSRENFAKTYKVDLVQKRYGNLVVLKATDMRSLKGNQMWECQCDCGNICYVSTNHLQTKNTQSCGCLRGSSIGEWQIRSILDENNIYYKQEYIFSELPNRRYDFAIFNNNRELLYLIEFDGEQHYVENNFFNNSLEEQRAIDLEKTIFAKSKNIKLIRIPYWKRNNMNMEDLK